MQTEHVKYLLYVRKSTDDDVKQVLSLPAQVSELNALIKREGLDVVDRIEESRSAKAPGRPQFNSMLERIERGEANGILCWDIDRLYRNPVDDGKVRWMLQCGILARVRTPSREYSPQDAGLLMAVEGGRAIEHNVSFAKNLRRTHDEKLRRGQWPGSRTWGFAFDERTRNIVPHPVESEHILALHRAFATGRLGLRGAALMLFDRGVKTRKGYPLPKSQVQRLLTNPLYMGLMRWKGEVYEGKFTPIVPADLFQAVQRALKRNGKPRKLRQGHNFPFCGIFRCSCGGMISAQWAKGRGGLYRYYRCTRKATVSCREPYVQEGRVAAQCLEILRPCGITAQEAKELFAVIDHEAESQLDGVIDTIEKTDGEIRLVTEKLRKLTRCLLDGLVDEDSYRTLKEDLIVEKARLKQERQRLHKSREISWNEPARNLVKSLETLGKNEANPNLAEISQLVQRIGTNHRISCKNVSFDLSPKYVFVPNLLALARTAASTSSPVVNDKNWWSTKWCPGRDSNPRPID